MPFPMPDDPSPESSRNARRHASADKRQPTSDRRTPGQRDRDRILYSSAFRRLAGVTQVASPTELAPVHNRLVHSLKVAQVGRSLAATLLAQAEADEAIGAALRAHGGLDVDVVEATCLAHDLGHPPFGHVAEETLDHLMVSGGSLTGVPDGFNGNAQSFRIVTRLSIRTDGLRGLDLTRATLNGILKYPWQRAAQGVRHQKWGAYDAEIEDFTWCREHAVELFHGKTIEAAVMDWADDITYAVHDVEDFFRAGLIPLDRLTSEEQEQERFLAWTVSVGKVKPSELETMRDALTRTEIIDPGAARPFRGAQIDRAWLRTMTSELIGRYIRDSVALSLEGDRLVLNILKTHEDEVRMLKNLAWCYVIESPSLVTQRYGQRSLITSLFNTFLEAATTRAEPAIFPLYYQEELNTAGGDIKQIKRIVADLIASMSEAQAIAINQRLTGQSLGSAMDAFLQ